MIKQLQEYGLTEPKMGLAIFAYMGLMVIIEVAMTILFWENTVLTLTIGSLVERMFMCTSIIRWGTCSIT